MFNALARRGARALAACIAATALASPAQASPVSSSTALLDFATLTFATQTGDAVVTLSGTNFFTADATTPFAAGTDAAAAGAAVDVADFYINGFANGIGQSGAGSTFSTAVALDAGTAFASTSADLGYTVAGTGTVLVTIAWSAAALILDGSAAMTAALFGMTDLGSGTTVDASALADGLAGDVDSVTTGTLSFLLTLSDGMVGSLFLTTTAIAETGVRAIGEPTALALTLAALTVLTVARRRA